MKKLPDILEIEPLTKPPNCTITVPGSKSITNRALILAALTDGKCTLRGALWADDTQVMVDSLQKLGFEVTVEPDPAEECNRTIRVVGRGGEIPAKKAELYVGNAGTAARFLTALVSKAQQGEYQIDGDTRMRQRPMAGLSEPLRQLGAEIESPNGHLPATIRPKGWKQGMLRVTELQRIGAKAEEHADGLTVWPARSVQLHGADIETYNDHRMAMCFAVLGLKVPGIRTKNPGCMSKTFPNFFEKLEQLRQ